MRVRSAREMQDFGTRVASIAQPSDVVILTGELGAGKTTFAQGVARGLGITELVTSPTFVMSKKYPGKPLGLIHLDVYRVGSSDELLDLWSEGEATAALTLVEWGIPWVREFGESVAELTFSEIDENDREVAVHSHGGDVHNLAQRITSVM